MQTLELCAAQQAGKACTDPACASFHAQAPAAAAAEAALKHTAVVCAYHLRGQCGKGVRCPAVHAQRAARPVHRGAPPPSLLPMVAVSPGHPGRGKGGDKPAPRALQLNSQTRGKIRQMVASEQRLAQLAASIGGCYAAEARRAAQSLAAVEGRLDELNEFIQGQLDALAAGRENSAAGAPSDSA